MFGVSVWNVNLSGAVQTDLRLDIGGGNEIKTDSIEMAIVLHLLIAGGGVRQMIDTFTSKVALILGRFTPERKPVLNALQDELRRRGYLPVFFDFQKPDSKDITGTVITLAHMAHFIIADLTDPGSVLYELAMVVPNTRVPVQTILSEGQREYAMFSDLMGYPWVLEPYRYKSQELLLAEFGEKVIAPAEAKTKELRAK